MDLKQHLLLASLGAVAVATFSAMCGVVGVGDEAPWIIFGCAVVVAICCLLGVGCAEVYERDIWRPLMVFGGGSIVVTGFGLILLIVAGGSLNEAQHGALAKLLGVLGTFAFGVVLVGRLALLNVPSSLELVRRLATAGVGGLAVMTVVAIGVEIEHDAYYQMLGVLALLVGGAALALHFAQRIQTESGSTNVETIKKALKLTCPRCLLDQTVGMGASRCRRCRLKFHIEMEEPRCPQCNYLLHMLTEPWCPECGAALAPDEVGRGG